MKSNCQLLNPSLVCDNSRYTEPSYAEFITIRKCLLTDFDRLCHWEHLCSPYQQDDFAKRGSRADCSHPTVKLAADHSMIIHSLCAARSVVGFSSICGDRIIRCSHSAKLTVCITLSSSWPPYCMFLWIHKTQKYVVESSNTRRYQKITILKLAISCNALEHDVN